MVRSSSTTMIFFPDIYLSLFGGLLFLPWFINIFAGQITHTLAVQLSTPAETVSTFTQQYNSIGDLFVYLPALLWLLLPVSILWGSWRHERGVLLIGLWWFLILLAGNPQWLYLPGEGALSNFAVFIAAYIPVSVLVGYLVGQVSNYNNRVHKSLALVLLFSVCLIGVWGAHARLGDLQVAQGTLVTRPDIRAAGWIQENTPSNARFLVNSFSAYGGSSIVGSDAGWWLPLLAQRQTTLPPLTYAAERGPRPDYIAWVNALTAEIQNKGITNPDVLALLRARDITYVYVGQRQGRVNYTGPQTLAPELLLASANFRLVYHQDQVWVFKIVW